MRGLHKQGLNLAQMAMQKAQQVKPKVPSLRKFRSTHIPRIGTSKVIPAGSQPKDV
jgi:hypothetical protein